MTVGAVEQDRPLTGPLTFVGVVFVLMQLLTPLQTAVSANLGNRFSAWLNEALIASLYQPTRHRPP